MTDVTEFKKELADSGFTEAKAGQYEPNCFNDWHAHDFDVRGLVLAGEMTITIAGEGRIFRPGEVFTMPIEAPHQERVGPDGCEYLYGARPAK